MNRIGSQCKKMSKSNSSQYDFIYKKNKGNKISDSFLLITYLSWLLGFGKNVTQEIEINKF